MKKLLVYCINKFNERKLSANKENTKYTIGLAPEVYDGTPEIFYDQIVFSVEQRILWTHGQIYPNIDLSNLVTLEDFSPVETAALNSIQKGTLGTINGQSLEDNTDITLDLSLYIIVESLPTENIKDNKIYLVPNSSSTDTQNVFDEFIYDSSQTPGTWELIGQLKSDIDLSEYLKKSEADKKYVPIGSSSGSGASISISQTGAFNNYGNNGQAFNAVRDVGASSITGKPINAASFGVKLDGTTAFSHKTYTTFNPTTGAYTGAKNTAVLTFSGQSGFRYAKNTGSAADVTDDMYKYVGVIDSPDEFQRVYSAKQVDDLLSALQAKITKLENAVIALGGSIE